MITTLLLEKDKKRFVSITDPNEISHLRENPQHTIWVDLSAPTEADFACLVEEFGFHHLAMDDCRNAHQRPKIEDYHGYYFIVLYEARFNATGALELGELSLFLGPNYVVTVHHQEIAALQSGAKVWQNWVDLAEQGAGLLAYLLIDAVVDEYFPIIDAMSDRMEEMEETLFNEHSSEAIEDIFQVKKQLLQLRRAVTPLRDVFNILLRREQPLFTREVVYYFHDIYDHLIRVADSIDNLRDLLGTTMDVYLSLQSNRMNVVMKRLTALSTILMSAALVSGIYGMNFRHMPELAWSLGYYVALAVMGLIIIGLGIFFRWIKWL